jgi:hypothetical protein
MMQRTARKASERDRTINRTARTEYPEEQEIPYADGMISFKKRGWNLLCQVISLKMRGWNQHFRMTGSEMRG